jgi:hypothetical protein
MPVWHAIREHRKQEFGIKRDQRKEVVMLGDGLNWIMMCQLADLSVCGVLPVVLFPYKIKLDILQVFKSKKPLPPQSFDQVT